MAKRPSLTDIVAETLPRPPPPPRRRIMGVDVPEVKKWTEPGLPAVDTIPPEPSPVSVAALPDGSRVSKATIRRIWVIVGPVVVGAAVSAWGYVKATEAAFQAYRAQMAAFGAKLDTQTAAIAAFGVKMDALQASVNRDGALYDDIDKRILRLERDQEATANRLDAISKTRAVIVKPSK